MPLTAHCQIEQVTGLEVLQCAPVETGAGSDGSPCDPSSCCAWETALYHVPQGQPQVAALLVAVVPQVLVVVTEKAPAKVVDRILADTPPDSPRPWQFSYRAALPPRAPSIAS